jgi:type IV pilus assembly protein PilE
MIKKNQQQGFTLIELMVVVAIVGILAAIAFPSYIDHVRKGRRNDGMNALLDAAGKMEIVRARKGSYTTDRDEANISTESLEGYYGNLTIVDPTDDCPISSCYLLEITGQNGQDEDRVTAYRLSSTGAKNRNEEGSWVTGWK